MDEIVKEFLVESYENLDMLDRAMVELEKDPRHKASLDSVFRTIHTVKGTCGFIGFGCLERLAHTGENLLGKIREGKLELNSDRTSALLAMVDAIRGTLAIIEQTGAEADESYAAIIEQLEILTEQEDAAEKPVARIEPAAAVVFESVVEAVEVEPILILPVAAPVVPAPVSVQAAPVGPAKVVPPAVANVIDASAPKQSGLSESTIRVDVNVLDKLMNLVGELVLARNQILQFSDTNADKTFLNACQRLNLITSEIQESFMKTRMQPIESVFGKFPRIIRDLTHDLGKRVRLETFGNETELDRTIIEAIKDPLTHVIRNSVDHGIEKPEDRIAAGKDAEGTLSLRAYHEGGRVNIEIVDDGAGINVDRVRKKAIEKGLITADQAQRLSERESFNLIFLPGFSTAESITNVSGRGVGMDVVKTNIEKIGGSVDVASQLGKGTTLKIKIPLTLAIIPALIVTSGGDHFAIPQVSLLELVRLEAKQAEQVIEDIDGSPVYRLRGNLLPLVYLDRELKLRNKAGTPPVDDAVNIVILQADGRQFGLVVEAVNDTEEIVVKPLSKQLKSVSSFAGATIRGDGRVALILDVMGLAQHARVLNNTRDRAHAKGRSESQGQGEERQSLLLFSVGEHSRLAIPLALAARLEEFPRSKVERTGTREVVQYRGQILPLVRVADYLPAGNGNRVENTSEPMQVVVYTEHGRSVGLIVGSVNDIVDEPLLVPRRSNEMGILGSAVVQGKVTDLLDVQAVIRAADPLFYDGVEIAAA